MKRTRQRIMIILRSILYGLFAVQLFILSLLNSLGYWLDKHLHTRLRAPKTTLADVERLIAASLPIGSNRGEIVAFTRSHGFRLVESSVRPEQRDAILVAWVENVGRDLLSQFDIRIVFSLDAQGCLVEYAVEGFHTSL